MVFIDNESELRKVLEVLGFIDLQSIPPMKEAVHKFRKMALKKHPDKPGGSKEQFQTLQEAFYRIGSIIEAQNCQKSEPPEVDDDFEESMAKKLFKDFYLSGKFRKSSVFHSFCDSLRQIYLSKQERMTSQVHSDSYIGSKSILALSQR